MSCCRWLGFGSYTNESHDTSGFSAPFFTNDAVAVPFGGMRPVRSGPALTIFPPPLKWRSSGVALRVSTLILSLQRPARSSWAADRQPHARHWPGQNRLQRTELPFAPAFNGSPSSCPWRFGTIACWTNRISDDAPRRYRESSSLIWRSSQCSVKATRAVSLWRLFRLLMSRSCSDAISSAVL